MPYRDPDQRRAYQRDCARLRRAARNDSPGRSALPEPIRVQTARDVLELLAEQINLLRYDPSLGTLERARTLGSLAGVSLRAVETADLEAWLAALEAILNRRETP